MESILVTGGAGFIGSHLAKEFLKGGYRITIADNLSTGHERNIPQGSDFIKIDLEDEHQYDKFKGIKFDAICHLAGQSSGEASFLDPLYDFNSHVKSTFLLLGMCKEKKINRFLYASSMAVYGDPHYIPVDELHPANPKTYYAAAKLGAEAYIKLYQTFGVNTTIFRLFSVYGPNQNLDNKMQGMVSIFLSFLLENKPIVIKGSKERFRDFTYIDDVVKTWIIALKEPKTFGKTYNVCSGKKTTVEELVKAEIESLGKTNHPIEYSNNTQGDQFGIVGDNKKLREELSVNLECDLRIGLKKMVEYYINSQENKGN